MTRRCGTLSTFPRLRPPSVPRVPHIESDLLTPPASPPPLAPFCRQPRNSGCSQTDDRRPFQIHAIVQYVADSQSRHQAGAGGSLHRASHGLPFPAARRRPAREAGHRPAQTQENHPGAWVLLAHAPLPLRTRRAGNQYRILAEQENRNRRPGPQKHPSTAARGMAGPDRLGVLDARPRTAGTPAAGIPGPTCRLCSEGCYRCCFASSSSSESFRRTLTIQGISPSVQWPYVVATIVPSGSVSRAG